MRWHAYNALTGVWLHRDLPLHDVTETYTLSGPNAVTATISPDVATLKTDAGTPLLDVWSTVLVGEESDQVRIAAILTSTTATGGELAIEATGFAGFAHGAPLEQSLELKQTSANPTGFDPLDITRKMWEMIQAQPDANLGVTLDATTSNYRIGTFTQDITTVTTKRTRKSKTSTTYTTTTSSKTEQQTTELAGTKIVLPKAPADTHKVSTAGNVITDTHATAKTTGVMYALNWWDNIDTGDKMDEFAKQVPFDYREKASWKPGKTGLNLHIELGHPRLGGRRADLRFAEGENITALVPVVRAGDDFANNTIYLGAGEGSAQVKGTAAKRDGRLRRVQVTTDTSLTTKAACQTQAAGALNAANYLADIQSVTLAEHPNAPFGSFAVGDDIYVRADIGFDIQALWVRVTGLTRDDAGTMTLTTKRSDSFRYVSVTE